ncbi:Excinuclease ABC subunit C [Ferrimonas balearica DSM 9799]|uniref:UvrABC system protein C n=1 Tax=Ferrimonas balearica (strain DSM 9799 / CCM 4581 / KCTC 23876 / PAT) TaxID=550540 RepID=E1SWD5_FERBD|nr:excinuclease ABC subunit UvrC [Ferrimonas balearica]ADN76417.1 Excinuclease ABC subunit C [Ferrimonas balearica DSM 9799]MBY6223037.1 excinuclease ABC subunit UvrC [Ferrimonas balearica]
MPTDSFDARAFLRSVTSEPGVYRMYDTPGGTVLYVGKAKDLKKRLSSYFRSNLPSTKTRALVAQIGHIEVTVTHTETEALILEHDYIKQYMPRYNVLLRDDKSYPYIFLSDHQHPRLAFHRGAKRAKGHYFGPYPNGGAVRESLHLMQKLFPIRQCEDGFYKNRSRPCLQYQLKRCSGPCTGMISDEDYAQQVKLARLFLQGQSQTVIGQLAEQMEQASMALAFEKAAQYRDQIQALRTVQEQQGVQGHQAELDIIGIHLEGGMACCHLLFVRQGKILGSRSYFPKVPRDTDMDELISSFLLQFYLGGGEERHIPKEIVLNVACDELPALEAMLSERGQGKVSIKTRVRGERAQFQRLAETNARSALSSRLAHKSTVAERFRQLAEALELEQPIRRMECFDISHTMGEKTVASCVVFNAEGPAKPEYRRYNISGITPGDDYAAMGQALKRRYEKVAEADNLPDILFIDGGKGQLSMAEAVMEAALAESGLPQPLMVGVAKGESRKPGLETLILGFTREVIHLPADAPALHLIQHIRDEAHRFAISGHRAARGKARGQSVLESIPGIGAKRRQQLLKFLGGMQELKRASVAELAKVPGISPQLAQKIYDALRT